MVSKKEKYLASAQKFIERGQLDKALAEYAKVVQEDPKETRTWLKMAELHAKRGANAEATEIYLRTGDLYVEQGFAQKAVAVYKNVLKLSPGTVPAHLKVGALFNQLGLISDAVQQFELAADALQRAGKASEAVTALRQAIDIHPDNVVLRVKLAESASHAGMIEEAVREFGKAAEQLKAQGRADEALRVVERLLFHQPDDFARARELAEAYIARGTPRQALPKLQACLNGDPRDPATLSLLARALEQLGQVAKAVSVLKELVRLCQDLDRSSERDAAVLRGLTLDPADHELLAMAARYQLRAVAEAADQATPPPQAAAPARSRDGGGGFEPSGVARAPAFGDEDAGRVELAVGVPESSGPFASTTTGVDRDVGRILAETEVFVKYGLLERAAAHLTRVFDLDPGHRPAREKLVSVLQRLGRRDEAARHAEILSPPVAEVPPPPGPGPAQRRVQSPGEPDDGSDAGFVSLSLESPSSVSLVDPAARGADRSLEIDMDDIDASDPVADMMTPPPISWSSAHELGLAGFHDQEDERRLPAILAATTDAELDGDVEFSIDDTPALVRTPMVIASPSEVDFSIDDDEDPATAFSEDVATVAGDLDGVAEALVRAERMDEEELSAELEQVSFFLDQAMSEEARSVLHDLQGRFPGNGRIAALLREVQALDARMASPHTDSVATSRIVASPILGSTVTERPPPLERGKPTPRAVVSHGGDSDSSTHADLAIAYKGMGLFDAAIAELKLLAEDERQEVFALTTMGECYEGKSSFTEAIIRYKRALNCEQISREETFLLYFLLGSAFERLGDVSEALYFYEKVLKRDPKFRDVDLKVAELRPRLVKRAR